MKRLSGLRGTVHIRITGGDPAGTLERINRQGILLREIRWLDALTVSFLCGRKNRKIIGDICRRQGDDIRILEETGVIPMVKKTWARPVFAMGILLLFVLTLYLPTRVLFIQVEGNIDVPELRILEAAENCGIGFGASRKMVRSEQMKNQLLEAIPELKWAGINTSGCTAVISVREQPAEISHPVSTGVSSIVAVRDGRITSCTVTRGNGLCVPGQIVRQGQLLISGYTDCGICIRVTEAEGEVFAETRRKMRVITPVQRLYRLESGGEQKYYSLILGKKRINLWKGSGISPVSCGRMYEEYYITLPGGFRLPMCLRVETLINRELEIRDTPPEALEANMKAYSRNAVLADSIAGSILRQIQDLTQENGCYILDSSFFCSEMIGRVITEEIGETNGKTD